MFANCGWLWFRGVDLCVIVFFSIIRRPPVFTLFPYTTLFRSRRFRRRSRRWGGRRGRARSVERPCRSGPDRKSTRLNSSHVEISYAVFCLKKKIIYVLLYVPAVVLLVATRARELVAVIEDPVV